MAKPKVFKPAFWRSAARFGKGALLHAALSRSGIAKGNPKHVLGFGAVYDLFLQASSKTPNRQAYNLLQAFKNYVLLSDTVFDSPDYFPRQRKKFGIKDWKAIGPARASAKDFVGLLKKSGLNRQQQKQMVVVFSEFRKKAAIAVERTMQNPFASKEEALAGVCNTTGLFFGTIAELAGIAHKVNAQRLRETKTALANFANALQIKDDLRDAVMDCGKVQNTVVSISLKYPEEHSRLLEKARTSAGMKHLEEWVAANLPKTKAEATRTFEQFVERIPKTKNTARIIRACRDIFNGI